MQKLTTYLWLAPIFVLIQILLFNNIQFFRYINPLVYLILIITLPQDTEKWFIILYAFFIGILLDLFEGNMGLNSSSLVFIAFVIPYLHKFLIPRNSIDGKDKLNLQVLGLKIFSIYALSVIFLHHTFLFALENFSINGIIFLLFKVLLSSIITFIIIIIFQLFTFKVKE
ncbi:MAG: hypothetical protein CMD02_07195 [Flavobacteriales bacterium]|nr:hypothetical protein [Flavobacteriales bacterium]|tara:strand:- start:5949 stop:6458 length:510 start_codon:yes stop_codon:yes gene_type:complete